MSIRIGTSGWHYKHWLGRFYPEKLPASKMLDFYIRHFDTVELNNSFYRLPSPEALRVWHDTTPPDFLFAVKGSRFLTHMKKLKDPSEGIRRFFERADILAEKVGPVLFQLPPNWDSDAARLRRFLGALPSYHRYAFEFRNRTWDNEEVLGILREHRAAYCIYDLAGFVTPLTVTADFVYLRLHGPGGKYQGRYTDAILEQWAGRIRDWASSGLSVYAYFDNDDSGFAPENARELSRRVSLT